MNLIAALIVLLPCMGFCVGLLFGMRLEERLNRPVEEATDDLLEACRKVLKNFN